MAEIEVKWYNIKGKSSYCE